jgi:hypothetical protein
MPVPETAKKLVREERGRTLLSRRGRLSPPRGTACGRRIKAGLERRACSLRRSPMPCQIVTDATGDTRHDFDVDDEPAVAEARKRFAELTDAGFIAAKRTGSGRSELIRRFDPSAEETLFVPRLVGG